MLLGLFLFAGAVQAQFTVTGNVTDPTDEPLIGVTVIVEGTTRGTVSDLDGNFAIEVPGDEGTLVLSYTGFKSLEIPVSPSDNVVQVSMEEDFARLEEVVVTGLASGVKRANAGNAVTSINAEELHGQTQQQSVDNALFGKIPGVQMSANSGAPGGGVNVQLRGVSTLGAGSSQPLYIIDGVYVNNSTIRNGRTQVSGASGGQNATSQDGSSNRIADINPDDIEKIEVLKGPSAAAIYGTRANAGVIIITTKKGTTGAPRISLSQDIGVAQGQNFQNFDDWDAAKVEAFYGTGDRGALEQQRLAEAQAEGRVTDWEEFFYGNNALLSNTQLSISGGSEIVNYYVFGGWTSEEGIVRNTGFDRYSIRANVGARLSDRIRVSLNTNYVRSENQRGFTGNQNNTGGSIGYNIAYTPTYADLFPDENGNYPNSPYFNDNPIAVTDLGRNDQTVDRFITAANFEWDIFTTNKTGLKFKVNGGVDYLSGNTLVYFPEILQHQQAQANPGDVMHGRQDDLNTNIQGFLVFNADIGNSGITSTTSAGAVRLDQRRVFQLTRGRGLSAGQTNLFWARVVSIQDQEEATVTDVGFVIQEDLNWKDRIAVSLGIRFDKSTLNRDQDKYYAFPKASLALNLHNFFDLGFADQVKLRAAYGETGGLPNFGQTFESLDAQLIAGQTGAQVGTRAVDPDLIPETSAEFEFGVDLGFLNNRLTFEGTYYNKVVRDLILDSQLPESAGQTILATNAADLVNRGFELSLGANPVLSENFNWSFRVMYWQNRSEITRLDVPTQTTGGFGNSLGTYVFAEGLSPTLIVGNPNTGNDTQDTPLGLTQYGDRQPDFSMSWFNQITFLKNFDFTFLFHYQEGGNAINLSALLWDLGGTTPEGLDFGNQRVADWSGGNTGVYIQPTSYLKLRELGLYYTIPLQNSILKRIKLGGSANNLLLWTNYGSYDPEVSNFGTQPVAGNIEVTPYPSSRRLFFHVKLDF
jgi:TonB-linked SusC/RagA family outer membrane protein